MIGPVSPSQPVLAVEIDILNLCVRSLKHIHVCEFFQPPEMEDTLRFRVILLEMRNNYLQLTDKVVGLRQHQRSKETCP